MPATWRLATDTELEVPDRQNEVGADWSLRGGVFRDFRYDWSWRKQAVGVTRGPRVPPGFVLPRRADDA